MNTLQLMNKLESIDAWTEKVTVDIEGRTFLVVDVAPGGILKLEEIVPPEPPPCVTCDRPRSQFPSIFRNDPTCCVACAKAAAQ